MAVIHNITPPLLSSTATPVGSWMSYADQNPPQVIQAETVERMSYPHPAFKPMAVPRDLVDRLKAIHGYPFIWFIGQFLHYLMRPSDELRTYIETSRERMGIRHPIVGYVGKGGGGGRRGGGSLIFYGGA